MSETFRIVFMGTPDFAVPSLQALLRTQNVVGVVTQPDRPAGRGNSLRPSPIKEVVLEAGVPLYQPESLRRPEQAEIIRAWQPDLIVVAAFGQILRPHLLNLPPYGCVNVHASLLPRWRGASPIQHSILEGDAEAGVCLMRMEKGLDTGGVYSCGRIPIERYETAQTLHDKLATLGAALIERDLPAIVRGELLPVPQEEALSVYAPMIDKKDGLIDWSHSAESIDRRLRAMTPWPGAWTMWQGQQLKLLSAEEIPLTTDQPIGSVVDHEQQIVVVTGEGGLWLHELQLQGKRPTTSADFVNGRPNFIGSRLGEN